ncbi:MAG: hypothetical protein AAB840_00855 [Patescibacteria group bacterium]
MTTVINNPGEIKSNENNAMSGGSGVVIGAVIVLILLVGGIILALPYLRKQIDGMRSPGNPTINVQLPAPTVPDTKPTP